MEHKIGAYICTGCGISDALDIDALVKVAQGDAKAAVCRTHECLCSEEGVGLIRQDIAGEGLTSVIVAACSMREKRAEFTFDRVLTNRVNLREHVAWAHEPNDEDTQLLGEDYLRMAAAALRESELPEPHLEEITQKVLVVGGGYAGLNAALCAARAGTDVVLVEKAAELGGFAGRMARRVPQAPPYEESEEVDVARLVSAVEGHDRITVHKGTTVDGISGAPGRFEVQLKGNGTAEKVGSIVVAAGFKPYDASKLGHLGYGTVKDVVTSVEFEEMARKGEIARPSDGEAPQTVAFIQCAGSRDPDHLPYCSTVCCGVSLKQAMYVKEMDEDAKVFVLYKDMRTPGQWERYYQTVQKQNVIFVKSEIEQVEEGDGGGATVTIRDVLLNDLVQIEVDLLVLAVGMQPVTLDEELLKLQYRQGPEMPTRDGGFPNSHFICFPYETQRTAIYAAGSVRQPMDLATAADDAAGAAFKAVKALKLMEQGKTLHPRVGDMSWPDFRLEKCTQCKRCTEECPFGAINEDEKGTPLPNPTRCRRCGVCMGACPERIINFADYSIRTVNQQIKAVKVPEEWEEKPAVLAFVCENDAYPAFDIMGQKRIKYSPYLRLIPLRCLGGLNLQWIADALAKGFDGVLLLGCKHGDDYQCHFVKGSELAETRLGKLQETLERLMIESERVEFHEIAIDDYPRIPSLIEAFMERIEQYGPNPFKD